jgi:hypothetical protein
VISMEEAFISQAVVPNRPETRPDCDISEQGILKGACEVEPKEPQK